MLKFKYVTADGETTVVDVYPAAISAWEIDTRQKASSLATNGIGINDCICLVYRQQFPPSKAGAPTQDEWAATLTEIVPVFGDPT